MRCYLVHEMYFWANLGPNWPNNTVNLQGRKIRVGDGDGIPCPIMSPRLVGGYGLRDLSQLQLQIRKLGNALAWILAGYHFFCVWAQE